MENKALLDNEKIDVERKSIAIQCAKFFAYAVERSITLPIQNFTGQELTSKDLKSRAKVSYDNFLMWLDEKGISPNRLVSIRVGMVLGGAPLAYYLPEIFNQTDSNIEAMLASISDNPEMLNEISKQLISTGVDITVLIGLLGDRLDGDLARLTKQCTSKGATLDAGADKVITIPALTAITGYQVYQILDVEKIQGLVSTLSFGNASLIASVLALGYISFKNIKNDLESQGRRDNNYEALTGFWDPPLPESERKPLEESGNEAPFISKLKTVLQMLVIAGYLKKELIQDLTNANDTQFNAIAATLLALAFLFGQAGQKKRISTKPA